MAVVEQTIVPLIFQARCKNEIGEFVAIVSRAIQAGTAVTKAQQTSEFFPGQEVTSKRLRTWRRMST